MNLFLEKVYPEEWAKMSANAHMISFGNERDPSIDRVDYTLLVRNDRELCCYATIIELDKDNAYMQHGGSFPSVAKGIYTVKGYIMFLNWLKEHYGSISTRVWNKNISMIKLALAAELLITGVECNDGDIFLNFMWKRAKKLEQ